MIIGYLRPGVKAAAKIGRHRARKDHVPVGFELVEDA
jgi:hypothetical protein